MFKQNLDSLLNLFKTRKQSSTSVCAFLDKEKRPGAQVVTESFVKFNLKDHFISVQGKLGAIESERTPGSYVAFSGVEISSEFFEVRGGGSSLAFKLGGVTGFLVLSLQIVLYSDDLYAVDLGIEDNGSAEHKLLLQDFKESYRGRLGEKKFTGEVSNVKAVRFYLKRSENLSNEKEPLNFSFNLINLVFTD